MDGILGLNMGGKFSRNYCNVFTNIVIRCIVNLPFNMDFFIKIVHN